MPETFRYALHGSSVIPEFTPDLTGHDNGLHLLRTGNGAIASQNNGTNNWFHFAFQTPTLLDDDRVRLHDVGFTFAINVGCRVTHFNVHGSGSTLEVKHLPPNEIVSYKRPVIYRGTNARPDFFPREAQTFDTPPSRAHQKDIRNAWDFTIFHDDVGGVHVGSSIIFSIGVAFADFRTVHGRNRGEIWFSEAIARFEEQ